MPSLRRVVSQPSIRPAPYSIQQVQALPPLPSPSTTARSPPRPLKRRSSTVQGGRVVLGEIEWWRVMRGQEPEPDDERDSEPDADADAGSVPAGGDTPEDELIAHAVRLAISNAAHEPAGPPELALVLAGENGPADGVPATPTAPRAPPRTGPVTLLSPPSSPPAMTDPLSPTSSHTSSPASSIPSSPTAYRSQRAKRPTARLASRHSSGSSYSSSSIRPLSPMRSLSFEDLLDSNDAFLRTDMSLDDILADLSVRLPSAVHAKASSEPASRVPSGSFAVFAA